MNITDDWRRAGRFVPALLVASALVTAALGSAGCNLWGKNDGGVVVGPQPTTPTSTVVTSPTVVATLSAPPSSTSSAVVHERPIPPQSTAPRPSSSAQDAMRAWYLAWFVGDMDAAKRTSTTSFASTISEHTFEGGDVTDYKILGTEGAAGTTAFYISETREGVAEKTQMTVLVGGTDAGSGYLVKE